jgi:hypothetical protein
MENNSKIEELNKIERARVQYNFETISDLFRLLAYRQNILDRGYKNLESPRTFYKRIYKCE